MTTLKLKTGDEIPSVGLGMWKVDPDIIPNLVQEAIKAGYRHFDNACDYGNELQVGEGLQAAYDAGLCQREDLWLTSKLWNTFHKAEDVREGCVKSLLDLQTDYLDLYLIHFPIALDYVPIETRYPPRLVLRYSCSRTEDAPHRCPHSRNVGSDAGVGQRWTGQEYWRLQLQCVTDS